MKSFVIFSALTVALLLGPELSACESCVPKGTKDPDGNGPYASAICWTTDTGNYSWCVGGNVVCSGGNPEGSCPSAKGRCSDDGSGGQVCIYDVEPLKAPLDDCSFSDIQGRCAGKPLIEFAP